MMSLYKGPGLASTCTHDPIFPHIGHICFDYSLLPGGFLVSELR